MGDVEHDVPVEVADFPGRSMLVLYGTETGNSQDIAEELGKMAQRLHFKTKVQEMDATRLNDLLHYTLVIFVIGTTGQGDMPANSLVFWKSLLRKRLPPSCLGPVRFTTFGLGDSSYPKFNWAVRKLHKRIVQLGATEFYPRGEGDEQDDDGIDEAYIRWSADLRSNLLEKYPLPDGYSPIPGEALLPPRSKLSIVASKCPPSIDGTDSCHHAQAAVRGNGADGLNPQYLSPPQNGLTDEKHRLPEEVVLTVPEGVVAVLDKNERVTPSDHWQDVRRLTFKIYHLRSTPLKFNPGDCLKLFPHNFPEDVTRLINLMSWQGFADVPLDLGTLGELPAGLYSPRFTTLRQLLTEKFDLAAIPRRSFFEAISHHTNNQAHKERLIEFTQSQYIDEYYDYATRPRRSILEVLEEFGSVKIPVEYLFDVFPVIRGRDFSIASIRPSPSSSDQSSSPVYELDLLVALVKYRTVLRKIRNGLFSRYLAPLIPGTPFLACHKPSLTTLYGPSHARRPLCALATGTGIAPIHALVEERLRYDDPSVAPTGRCLLFFGNRSRDKDFFFKEEWDAISPEKLTVHTAFSRDQREKIYIQNIVRQQSRAVAGMVREDAIFIVCGGSSKMAQACRAAVTDCIIQEGICQTQEEADERFRSLTWWQEIW